MEAIAAKSALDTAVIGHLKAIKPKLTALQAAWKVVEDNWATDTDAQKLAHVKGAKAAFDAIEVPALRRLPRPPAREGRVGHGSRGGRRVPQAGRVTR